MLLYKLSMEMLVQLCESSRRILTRTLQKITLFNMAMTAIVFKNNEFNDL